MIETPHNYVRVDMCMANMKWKIHILQLTWLLTLRPSLCEHYLHVIGCRMCWELRHHIFMKYSLWLFFPMSEFTMKGDGLSLGQHDEVPTKKLFTCMHASIMKLCLLHNSGHTHCFVQGFLTRKTRFSRVWLSSKLIL